MAYLCQNISSWKTTPVFQGRLSFFFVIGFIPHSAVADAMETVAMQLAASEAIVQEHVGVS